MQILILFLLAGTVFAQTFCIKDVRNETNEPYLSYSLLRIVERALLENGYEVDCDGSFSKIELRVKEFKEIPIAYTPEQRVSSYNLILSVELKVNGKDHTLRSFVPYDLPYGGLGDLPRRKAIDDLLDKIYIDILEILRRWKDADKHRDQQER